SPAPPRPASAASAPASAWPAASAFPCRRRTCPLAFPLARVQRLSEHVPVHLLAGGLLVRGRRLACFTELEDEIEAAAGHVEERIREQARGLSVPRHERDGT